MRVAIAAAAALATLVIAAPAGAQLPLPLPPIGPPGGQPPPPEQPPPQNQPPAAQPLGSPPTGSVTDGVDPAHTGFVDDPNLVPPLQRRWTRTFSNDVRGVRAAEGKLFTVQYKNGRTRLHALDPLTGRDLWVRDIANCGDIAYDNGRLFAPGSDGVLRAYSAADGALIWESRLHPKDQMAELHGPVAAGGAVYVNDHGVLTAVRQSDGSVIWDVDGAGNYTEPALDPDRVYVNPGCDDAYAVARSDGRKLWTHQGCGGAGSQIPPTVFGSRLYVPDSLQVLDAASGSVLGSYPGSFKVSPVFARGLGLFLGTSTFTAVDAGTGARRWRRKVGYDSDAKLTLSPVAVGHSVYGATSDGVVYALDIRTGARLWHATVPYVSGVSFDYDGAMDVAPGLLLVPGGRKLTAYESVFRPASAAIAFAPALTDVQYRAPNSVDGVAGTDLRTKGARVSLEFDERPFRGFRRLARARIGSDGYFSFSIRTGVNVRLRVRSGKAVSRVRTIYTYPRLRFKVHRLSPDRIRVAVTTSAPPSVRLRGRRMSLYITRARTRRAELLGTSTLSGRGRGRAAAGVVFRALRHVGRRDYLAVCIKGQLRLGLGRPNRFLRRCGRRRIRF